MKTRMARMLLLLLLALVVGIPRAHAFYNPTAGKWVNRDPIGERGGANLHGFVGNNPLAKIDRQGMDSLNTITTLPKPTPPTSLPRNPTKLPETQPRFEPKLNIPSSKCCAKPQPGVLGLGLGVFLATEMSLNGGENEALKYYAFKSKCEKSPKNLDNCLDICVEEGLVGQELKECFCACWKLFPKTPRQKSRDRLIKEWEEAHPWEQWPNEPEFPDLPQIPHHVWPLADGGPDDGRTNIEPVTREQHLDIHEDDRSRWGRRTSRRCD